MYFFRARRVKFCVKLGKPATETTEMITNAFGNQAMSRSKTFERRKRFIAIIYLLKGGREDIFI